MDICSRIPVFASSCVSVEREICYEALLDLTCEHRDWRAQRTFAAGRCRSFPIHGAAHLREGGSKHRASNTILGQNLPKPTTEHPECAGFAFRTDTLAAGPPSPIAGYSQLSTPDRYLLPDIIHLFIEL